MPVFKVKVRSVTIYESHILVAAKDEVAAMDFLYVTEDWKNDTSLDNIYLDTYYDDKIPLELNEIFNINEAPIGWNSETVPWNSEKEIGELLRNNRGDRL